MAVVLALNPTLVLVLLQVPVWPHIRLLGCPCLVRCRVPKCPGLRTTCVLFFPITKISSLHALCWAVYGTKATSATSVSSSSIRPTWNWCSHVSSNASTPSARPWDAYHPAYGLSRSPPSTNISCTLSQHGKHVITASNPFICLAWSRSAECKLVRICPRCRSSKESYAKTCGWHRGQYRDF